MILTINNICSLDNSGSLAIVDSQTGGNIDRQQDWQKVSLSVGDINIMKYYWQPRPIGDSKGSDKCVELVQHVRKNIYKLQLTKTEL